MRWIFFLLVVSFITIKAMDFEMELEKRKNELVSPFSSSSLEKKLKEWEEFLQKSDLDKEKNKLLLKTFVHELQMTADWHNTHSEIGGRGRNESKFDLLLLKIQPFIRE